MPGSVVLVYKTTPGQLDGAAEDVCGHQRATMEMRMQLLLELFVNDLARSREFYTRVLGFEIREQKARGYTGMRNGEALIGGS
jgi:hypothetical protein